MKILFDHARPFLLAHGGVQRQIEETKAALERAGAEVEYLRWWDPSQAGDVIHYFGPVPYGYLHLARRKKIAVFLTSFFSETCNRPDLRLRLQGLATRSILALPIGRSVKAQLQWQAYREATHHIVGLEAEADVLRIVYGIPDDQITKVPLGIDRAWLEAPKASRSGDYLISVGTIYDVKQVVPLAEMAQAVSVPVLFVGDPYSSQDKYWMRFQSLVDGRNVRHHPHVSDQAQLLEMLSRARGFVLFSRYENWSLAAHEAAAIGLPLLLPDMKWSRECFGDQVWYFDSTGEKLPATLRRFYDSARDSNAPVNRQPTWDEVARQLMDLYRSCA